MATVVNEMTIEPKVTPQGQAVPPPAESGDKGEKAGPDLERQIERVTRTKKQRLVRLWAH